MSPSERTHMRLDAAAANQPLQEAYRFSIGDKVQNVLKGKAYDKERFRFKGVVVSRFRALNDEPHYVVENSNGVHRIYSYFLEKQP